ncbi:MAG: P-II family nitrogen regulator [Clostridia bacterium]|nr:P-II family nitrogen regulator [Clostridia bacterium]
MKKFEVIFCIVNAGFSEEVMEAARNAGARGGTVMHARGTANPQAEKMFGVSVQANKEIVMILVEDSIKEGILHALYGAVGQKSKAQGIAFSMQVDDVVGLSAKAIVPQEEQPAVQPTEEDPQQ